ncbi:Dabb family protein [Phyllobacterium sp. 628]|uniref:Dabb family protein n=1 Tax=Phyllobacterium sp. 628 TaxID=2718938 RepID=UPI0016627C9C|nr:Dabb family protein [Phyllobacterium sp. 628]QND51913.1 Dabb family protein [Phyllobacterium sp. 628]
MIRHCVFIRFREEASASDRQAIYSDLDALCTKLAGVLAFRAGSNVSPEIGMDKGFSDGFIIDFSDAGARDAYLVDDRHQALGSRIVASAVGGVDGVFVFDLDM